MAGWTKSGTQMGSQADTEGLTPGGLEIQIATHKRVNARVSLTQKQSVARIMA